ncbi:MAG: ATP-grasp domain-containing protein, partial [Halocynthiibacter sp.]
MNNPLPTGATIGILGGGQLGRMLALAAARLGFKTHIFEPAENPSAGQVCDQLTTASYEDEVALKAFAKAVDVITYEFENIPTSALDILESQKPIHPNRTALSTSQDRLVEKTFLQELGLKTAPFANVESDADLTKAVVTIDTPAILKTRRFGYDGKGQVRIMSPGDQDGAFAAVGENPSVLEG